MTRTMEPQNLENKSFDAETTEHLVDFAEMFESPCLIFMADVGRELVKRGKKPAILDVDKRLSSIPGFRSFDLGRPVYTSDSFDLIICDPPANVSHVQLFHALKVLTHFDFETPILVTTTPKRANAFKAVLSPFEMREVGFVPQYASADEPAKEFWANFDAPLGLKG